MIASILLTALIGFAGGLAVGGGFVAFLTVLGVIPRLMQLTKTMKYIQAYEWAVISGAVLGGWAALHDYTWRFPTIVIIVVGLASGTFIGMLAAALTEVLNVLPILAKRIGIADKIVILLMAIVFGKIFGSLFHWVYFVDQ
ncbi:stage V sporulation protein AB [Metabacillus iocasae]|uniref:Stage V sporulation protein AB n=1 Tax=Priestia iocasae TaxID=2291674 RepID=A0ABS2QT00_9BACI|nr:stage V sporulation protein AB [Metabacillus iocasae]MBM7701659.1 stage V sporulation protein AB [Metabacillus iocasae]